MVDRYLTGVEMLKAGTLLVAHPNLPQRSLFANSVILLTEHTKLSSVGIIVNKDSGHKINDLFREHIAPMPDNFEVFRGGPVNPGALILLHSDEWYSSNTMPVPGGFAISSDNVMLEKFSQHNTPQQWRMVVGVSGWSPGQLEEEINKEIWLTCEPSPSIIFEHTGKSQWRRAVDLCATQAVAQYF